MASRIRTVLMTKAVMVLLEEFQFVMAFKKLTERSIHCSPCSGTNDIIYLLP